MGTTVPLFGLLKRRSAVGCKKFDDAIDALIAQNWLHSSSQGLLLTSHGQEVLATKQTPYSFANHPELNQKFDYQLWQAILLLMVQVASEYRYHNSNYYVANQNLKAQFLIRAGCKLTPLKRLRRSFRMPWAIFRSM